MNGSPTPATDSRVYGDDRLARPAVVLALVFPSSVFLSCFYADGIYFFAIAGALWSYEQLRFDAPEPLASRRPSRVLRGYCSFPHWPSACFTGCGGGCRISISAPMWGTHRVGPAGRDRRELCRRQWCDERQSSGSAPRSWRFTSSCWARPSWPAEAHAVHTRSAPGRPTVRRCRRGFDTAVRRASEGAGAGLPCHHHSQQKSSCTPSVSATGELQLSEESSVTGLSPDSHWYPYEG